MIVVVASKKEEKKDYVSESGPGVLYGLPKIHKPNFCTDYQFRPIFAAYNAPTFNIAKFLEQTLSPLTVNSHTVSILILL